MAKQSLELTTMAKQNFEESAFELDYLFDVGKDVFGSFRSLGTFYSHLHDFDRAVLLHIHADIRLEYRLENVSYGSLKTKVIQVLKSVPDEILADPEVMRRIGLLLLQAKYWLLHELSETKAIDGKEQVQSIADKINSGINDIGKGTAQLTTNISTLSVFKALDELSHETNKLPKKEAYRYKSKVGNAVLRSGINVNKPKILAEIGNTTEKSETTEIIKPKKVDLLGLSKWECILNGRTREMKVEDTKWLEKYHNRQVDIQSGDSLKVKLRTIYGYDVDSKTKVTFEIIKILGVIKPGDTKQLSFE